MRLVGFHRAMWVGTACMSMLAGGCTHAQSASATTSETVRVQTAASVDESVNTENIAYVNPNYDDEEERSGNPVVGVFGAIGRGIGSFATAVVSVPVDSLKWLSGERPGKFARMLEDNASADNRRVGINKLLEYDFTKRDPYTRMYRILAQTDKDPTVRAAAIRASNRARDEKATKVFINSLDDRTDAWVRLEAAKGLSNVPDPAASVPLQGLLANPDENRDVRIASADALKHYRTLAVARALVAVLNDRDFAVSWQARRSLKYLFHRDYGYSDSAWLAFLSGLQSPVK